DGDLRIAFQDIEFLYYVQEIKNEVSTSGSDPYIEAIHYWFEQIRICLKSKNISKEDLEHVNFPAIILLQFRAYLAVAVVAYTDEPVVEHLACVPLHVHSTNEEEPEVGERVVASLRLALADLRTLYSILSDKSRPRADFPFRNFFEANGCEHYFTYEGVIEDKRVFHAHLRCKDPTSLCIKFSWCYSDDAHQATFNLGLAPKLYAVNYIYGWFMVVMEDASTNYMTL
ncbi:hypothetical protein SCLCIDRAFT_71756, partial [Scleroderma citrinum Foug A]